MLIGWDPGKRGAACLMDRSGRIVALDPMPVDKAGICRVGIANLYKKYRDLMEFDDEPRVVVEKIYTPPSDAITVAKLKALIKTRDLAAELLLDCASGYQSETKINALNEAIRDAGGVEAADVRLDGRKSVLSYAKGAGFLYMPALWQWPIVETHPKTWMAVMYRGIPGHLVKKERSIYVAKSLWPKLFDKDAELSFYRPGARNVCDGKIESALISEWFRRSMSY